MKENPIIMIMNKKGETVASYDIRKPVKIKDGLIVASTHVGTVFILSLDGEKKGEFKIGNEIISCAHAQNNGIYLTSYNGNIYFDREALLNKNAILIKRLSLYLTNKSKFT